MFHLSHNRLQFFFLTNWATIVLIGCSLRSSLKNFTFHFVLISFAYLGLPDKTKAPSPTSEQGPGVITDKTTTIPELVTTTLASSSGEQGGSALPNEDNPAISSSHIIGIAIGAIFIILLAVAFMFYKRYVILASNMQVLCRYLFYTLLYYISSINQILNIFLPLGEIWRRKHLTLRKVIIVD